MALDGSRRRAYVTHQSLSDHTGGASAVTAWVLQALSQDYEVCLATPDLAVDFLALDEMYGTSLSEAGIGLHTLAIPDLLRRIPPGRMKSLRLASAFRNAELHTREGDLVFNTANEMSFSAVSANYIHCPIRHPQMVRELCHGTERWMRLANNAVFKGVARFNEQSFLRATCVANSNWTAAALRRTYGLDACVIHPPVTRPLQVPLAMNDRSSGFVSIGRITAEKRTHEAIDVVDALRRQGHDVHLHIVGSGSGAYMQRIEMSVAERPHVHLHRGISRTELAGLLDRHRFGLHMMRNEHFGMAVAEMTVAGMLVLAHRSAGPMEILGAESPLLFADAADAIAVAGQLLQSQVLREEYLAQSAERGVLDALSPEAFMHGIRLVAKEASS
jgi:glycosyltransferase involved in cell wall biosynthesis